MNLYVHKESSYRRVLLFNERYAKQLIGDTKDMKEITQTQHK